MSHIGLANAIEIRRYSVGVDMYDPAVGIGTVSWRSVEYNLHRQSRPLPE